MDEVMNISSTFTKKGQQLWIFPLGKVNTKKTTPLNLSRGVVV
jgi:hypothetical protein